MKRGCGLPIFIWLKRLKVNEKRLWLAQFHYIEKTENKWKEAVIGPFSFDWKDWK